MIQSVLVIPDLQLPYTDFKSLKVVEKYMDSRRWDGVIYIGDFLDLDMISRHNEGNARELELRRIEKDYALGREILDRHIKIVRKRAPRARFWLIEGNHEYRMEAWLDRFPQFEGKMEVPIGLQLAEKDVEWVPFWSKGEVLTIGHASFIHGRYTNEHHAKKHADHYGVNIFYGHTHDIQSFSKVAMANDKVYVGQSLGCLCERDQIYMHGAPSKWMQGFGIFYFRPDGLFTYYVPRIFDHKFISPEGFLYS